MKIVGVVVTDFGVIDVKKKTLASYESIYLKKSPAPHREWTKKSEIALSDALGKSFNEIARYHFLRGEDIPERL